MELYEAGLQLVGWRMKPGLSLRDAAGVISALAEGVLMRLVAEPELLTTIFPRSDPSTAPRSLGRSWPSAWTRSSTSSPNPIPRWGN